MINRNRFSVWAEEEFFPEEFKHNRWWTFCNSCWEMIWNLLYGSRSLICISFRSPRWHNSPREMSLAAASLALWCLNPLIWQIARRILELSSSHLMLQTHINDSASLVWSRAERLRRDKNHLTDWTHFICTTLMQVYINGTNAYRFYCPKSLSVLLGIMINHWW